MAFFSGTGGGGGGGMIGIDGRHQRLRLGRYRAVLAPDGGDGLLGLDGAGRRRARRTAGADGACVCARI